MKTLKSYYLIVAFLGVGGVKTRTMVLLFFHDFYDLIEYQRPLLPSYIESQTERIVI